MKALHLSFVLMAFLFCSLHTQAQDQEVLVDARKINSKSMPKSVQDSLRKNFPHMTLKQVLKMPLKTYKTNWNVSEDNVAALSSDDYSVYVLNITGKKGGNMEATYNQDGQLIEAKEILVNSRLPRSISTYIVQTYKGYLIDSDKIKRTIRPDKTEQRFEVAIHKGSDKKRLFFDNDGNFIKEKE
jgi:hypothetical protein